jgi:polar amino acid transport system substrate-binding protein
MDVSSYEVLRQGPGGRAYHGAHRSEGATVYGKGKRVKKLFSGLVGVLLVLCLSLPSANGETIILGAEDDWIPYSKADGTGMANEIVAAAFKSVGIDVDFKVMPYNRILKLVEWGDLLGGFNVPLDEESKRKYILGNTSLYDAVSAYNQNREKPLKAKTRDELVHKEKIGVVLGYGYGDHFLKAVEAGKIIKEDSRSEKINLKKLAAGRIDATIIYDKTASVLLKELGLENKIEAAFINETTPIFLAFSRKNPKGQYYADQLDKGLANIKKDGTYKRIMDSY